MRSYERSADSTSLLAHAAAKIGLSQKAQDIVDEIEASAKEKMHQQVQEIWVHRMDKSQAHEKATTGARYASRLQDDPVRGASPVEARMRLKILMN